MRILPTAAALGALLLSTPAGAQQRARQAPPPLGTPKAFHLPTRREFTLANGMKVTFVPFGNIPKVTVMNTVRTGNIDEEPGHTWLADVTGELMREGTTTRTALQLAELGASMGGAVSVGIGEDVSQIGGTVLSEGGPEMVRLVADVTRNPRLPESELPRIIAGRLRSLAIAKSQPGSIAQEKFMSSIYGDHTYGRIFPSESELKSYTIAQARDFYARNFGAARSHLYVVGVFDEKAMERAVRESFTDWKAGAPKSSHPAQAHASAMVTLIDRPNAPQSTIDMGLPVLAATSPDFVALQVTDAILGGTFGSRITTNIREQKGYTYSPRSSITSHPGTSVWSEQADVTTKDTGASLKEIFAEIARLQAEAPPAAELEGVKNNMIGIFTLQNASRGGIASQLVNADVLGLGPDYLSTYVGRVSAVTPADVQRLAKDQIRADRMTIVVVGDKKTVEEQLAPYQHPVP
ncbi:MAG: pitrilysin family protein [bacterium]